MADAIRETHVLPSLDRKSRSNVPSQILTVTPAGKHQKLRSEESSPDKRNSVSSWVQKQLRELFQMQDDVGNPAPQQNKEDQRYSRVLSLGTGARANPTGIMRRIPRLNARKFANSKNVAR